MFGISNKQKKVQCVVHIEIAFNLTQIQQWIENDFKGDLLDKKVLDVDSTWLGNTDLTYKIELLPHPNGSDSIFYHKHNNTFSNSFSAFHEFTNSIYKRFPNIRGNIIGVEWNLHRLGGIVVFVNFINHKKGDKKYVIAVPTSEVFQLQIGNNLSTTLDKQDFKEKVIKFDVSPKESTKINRILLGLSGKGVGYRNKLCRIKAYLPGDADYNW